MHLFQSLVWMLILASPAIALGVPSIDKEFPPAAQDQVTPPVHMFDPVIAG